eukprot:CAMPEP_0194174270 /NCGR_PEP_ID=MMETSP0154-20130528/8500_1 /TAXON_ID=1049557 /ORGANISM="Thalassiothrix antarctica, Strain L6-D1" /LENGTH=167 /DNA_ID=CAMNT_0038887641 /DNA_START=52 /DNA_END=555 /DNA_ORIENTATION=-
MTRISLALFLLAGILTGTVTSFGLNRLNEAAPRSLSLYASEAPNASPTPLCELQTFLKLCDLTQSGGEAKVAIQSGKCNLNGQVETRRAKKLFEGDVVAYKGSTLYVLEEVRNRGYVYKIKVKKPKPVAKVDEDGNLEFGGKYRSDEWRADRKQKKAERKALNSENK